MCEKSNRNLAVSTTTSVNYSTNCICQFSPIIPIVLAPHSVGGRFVSSKELDADRRLDWVWISDYSDDIFLTFRETELMRRVVCFRSQQGKYRPNLLRLLKVATEKHALLRITLHLAVYLLDCFMDNYTIRPDKLNLTALTCLIVAAKIEEADMDTPKFTDLNKLVGDTYTIFEFKNVEFKVLSTFHFELIRPTAATFIEYFANNFVTLDDFHIYLHNWRSGAFQQLLLPLYINYEDMVSSLSKLLFELVDVSLNYMKFVNARPSIIAAACIAAVRRMKNIRPIWTPYLIKVTGCTDDVIEPFAEAILTLYNIHVNNERARFSAAAMTPLTSSMMMNSANILCDSPDSGIVCAGSDLKSDTSDVDDDESDDEDEYFCLEYPVLAKRRRIY